MSGTNGKSKLPLRYQQFVHHYTAGAEGVRGNAAKSAEAAGFSPNGSKVTGCRLLQKPAVKAAVAAFRDKAEALAVAELVAWVELIPEAQQTLRGVASGAITENAATRAMAADKILDRAMGKPPTKLQVSGRTIDDELAALDHERGG